MVPSQPRKRWKWVALAVLGIVGVAAGVLWTQRTELRVRYYVSRLERAGEDERQAWVERIVAVGEPAIPRLLDCFRRNESGPCAAARLALETMATEWGHRDPRCAALARQLIDAHPTFGPAGQLAALEMIPPLLAADAQLATAVRPVVESALKHANAEQRLSGLRLAVQPEVDLLGSVVPLLNDPAAEVRRAAMLALGPVREGTEGKVSAEDLLHWLHDSDPEVRRLCELSLRGRGLRETDIQLGRRFTDPDPAERLQLLLDLRHEDEIDPSAWLERLSNDPVSAVRAGAVRVAAERRVPFADRLDEMSQADPDQTVRKIAAHYRRLYAPRER